MRLNIDRNEFLKGLGVVGKAIPAKSAMPILSNLKMTLSEKGLELVANDGDLAIETVLPYNHGDKEIISDAKHGATLVSFRYLNEIVRKMEGEILSLEVVDNITLRLDDGKSNFKLNCIRANEYPDIDNELSGSIFEIRAGDLVSLVELTAFAASTKEVRPVLTAINFDAHENVLTTTATDTARLARKRIEVDQSVTFSVNVLAKRFLDIVRSFEDSNEQIAVGVSDKKIVFSFGLTTISMRLINVDYPNTKNIIPKSFNYHLEVNAKEFLSAMDRVSVLSSDHDGVVKLIMTEDEVEILSKSIGVGSASEKISTFHYEGERLEVSFKSSFVIDAIKALKSEDITIAFVGEMKPFVIKNVKDDSIDMLITPLRSQ